MLLALSALKGYTVAARDGDIGTIRDVLFDDKTWTIRWLVVDTGTWLSTRKVLIQPSSVEKIDYQSEAVFFALTMAQIEASPDLSSDEPVSRQMEDRLYDYYDWDPYWGGSFFGLNTFGVPVGTYGLNAASRDFDRRDVIPDELSDPHLRSAVEVTGYHINATDGTVGHVENFLFSDESWDIRYRIIDTKNWWPAKHVLLSPYTVRDIDVVGRELDVSVTRDLIKTSPPWDPAKAIVQAYEEGLHHHYGCPGYGWSGSEAPRPMVS